MPYYNYNENNSTLQINQPISNLTVNGSKNKIVLLAKVSNLIINGSKNEINSEHRDALISNSIINGDHNKLICSRKSSNFNKIDNGRSNSYVVSNNNTSSSGGNTGNNNNNPRNTNSYPNSNSNSNNRTNYSIQINNSNGVDSNIFEFINNVTGNLGVNIQLGNNMRFSGGNNTRVYAHNSVDSDEDISFSNESEDSIVYFEDEDEGDNVGNNVYQEESDYNNIVDEEALREEAYREMILQKRAEVIDDFNIFQFKHWNKFVRRAEDTCSICLEKFKNSDICKQFSCSEHFFHKTCLESWLESSNYCPLCKYDLMDDVVIEEGEEIAN